MNRRQPAHVRAANDGVLSLDPRQRFHVLLVAVIDGLVTRALRIHVNDGIDQARLAQPGGERHRA